MIEDFSSQSRQDPCIRIFTEARLHRGPQGSFCAVDVSNGSEAWDGYADRLGWVELAARVGPPDTAATAPVGKIGVHPLPFYRGPRSLLRQLPHVLRAICDAAAGANLCVFRLPGPLGFIGAAWSRMHGRPYVVEVIGDPVGVLQAGVLGPLGRLLAPVCGALMRWIVSGAAAGQFVTESALQQLYPLGHGAAEHSYSNVRLRNEDFVAGPRTQLRPTRRLIAVGTHDQLYKGHDDLLRAVALLSERGVEVQLDLVGDGRHHADLKELARSYGVADRVKFHGRVNSRSDLRALLDEADLFCMPSRTEGLPRALVEAMARAVPAIGTAVGGIPELIEPQFCTRPDDPEGLANMISSAVRGEIDTAKLSRANWLRSKVFAPEEQARRVAGWLDEIDRLARDST